MFASPETAPEAISQVLSWVRELSIISFICVFGWKARGIYGDITDFTKEVRKHMRFMNKFARVVVENHLRHIEADMAALSGRPVNQIQEVIDWDSDDPDTKQV